jgi:hypothetical protein
LDAPAIVVDAGGAIRDVNAHAATLLGEAGAGRRFAELPGARDLGNRVDEAIRSGRSASIDAEMDGFRGRARIAPLVDGEVVILLEREPPKIKE